MNILKKTREENPENEVYFLDIGANIGWYTLAAASLGFKTLAFEPFNENLHYIEQSLLVNEGFSDLVTVYDYALGDKESQC